MLREMPSRTFTEWMAYYTLEPFGDELIDLHFAKLNGTLIDQWKKKGSEPTDPKTFRLWKQIKKPFDPQKFYDGLKMVLRAKKK